MKDSIVSVFPSVEKVLYALADFIVKKANEAIGRQNEFTIALSGGSSPKKLYELLASSAYKDKIDWAEVYFFFGDERNVPQNDPESNSLMAEKALFIPLKIPATNIFKVDTSLSPEAAANAYFENIKAHFASKPIQFDLILLGLGDDAHTASLFPHTEVLTAKDPGVKAVFLNDLQVYRITFTAPLINQATCVAFLIFGKGKAEAIKHAFDTKHDVNNYPVQLIHPESGSLYWFMDEAAASV